MKHFEVCPECGGEIEVINIGWKCKKCRGVVDMKGEFHKYIERPFMLQQTNADKIRAMSDDELVELFHEQIACGRSFIPCGVICCNECDTISSKKCRIKIKEWLQQPSEGSEWNTFRVIQAREEAEQALRERESK